MGTFAVPIRVRYWQNRFLSEDRQGEEVTCEALGDADARLRQLATDAFCCPDPQL